MRGTVVVVTAPGHPALLQSDYLVRHVVEHWSQLGIQFVLTTDPRVAPKGEIGWQHLDVTRVPDDYQALVDSYPIAINGGASDVHKRGTATHLVEKADTWNGPVILKTDLNYGGKVEDLAFRWRLLRHPWLHAARSRLPLRISGRMAPSAYPTFSSKADVPAWVWRDRRFVVQRFLAERRDEMYGIRRWFFFGEREFAYRAYSPRPVVMGDNHAEWERLETVPGGVRTLREELGLDFGKVDYAEVDGQLVIYDVSPAVSADGPPDSAIQKELIAELVPGLELFLHRAGL